MKKGTYKHLIEGLQTMGPVEVLGQEYTGGYLALLVSVNPNLVAQEAADTIRLIAELGRLTAIAYREKESATRIYRQWRDGEVFRLTNNMGDAVEAGFACAASPGKDAKGKDKPQRYPAISVVETYLRTCPAYQEHYEAQESTEEAWATIHSALEAARQRVWMLKLLSGPVGDNQFPDDPKPQRISGVVEPEEPSVARPSPPPPPPITK